MESKMKFWAGEASIRRSRDQVQESWRSLKWVWKQEESLKLIGKWDSFKTDSKTKEVSLKFKLED